MVHRCMIKSVVMVAACIGSVLVVVCMSHCSGVDYIRTVRHTHINKDTTNIHVCSHITFYTSISNVNKIIRKS